MRKTSLKQALWGVALASIAGCGVPEGGIERGDALFANNCTPCHGNDGAGNPSIAAPAIAGLEEWYVKAQLDKFRSGARGTHFDDIEGMRMRPMSLTLKTDVDVQTVAAYVAAMPPAKVEATLQGGHADKGKVGYATCAACHGPDARGNKQLNAPGLKGAHDWYLLSQLKKFKSGTRGSNPADVTGAQMAPMAATLKSEQDMLDVIAHIQTL